MDTPENTPTHKLKNPEQYITRAGKFLRRTSLDELPQIFNIIRGQMSFVGPRPVLWNEYDLIAEREKYGINQVRPGLTGLAQISGRDELSIQTKSKVDALYVKNMNFLMDAMCIYKTIGKVVRHDGVVEGGKGSI